MSTDHYTETDATADTADVWPPLAHMILKTEEPVKEGRRALCGARLQGIELTDAHKVCVKCVRIARGMSGL